MSSYRDEFSRAEKDAYWSLPKVLLFGILFFGALGALGFVFSMFSEAGTVAQKEFGATALLKKYEWFKDASAQLDQKLATGKVYESRFASISSGYPNGTSRSAWAREDREQFSTWQSELAGIKASYNDLAAQYNAEMVKFNWRFASAGELPQGATIPLPREYKPYTTN